MAQKVYRVTTDKGAYDITVNEPDAVTPPAAAATVGDRLSGARSAVADTLIGGAKGAANTAIGLGELVHRIPGVSNAVDSLYGQPGLSKQAFGEARQMVAPSNTAQSVGRTAEQMGEFFLPVGGAGKVGTLAEIGKSGALTLAQGGSPTAAGVNMALSAAIPAAAALLSRSAKSLNAGAEKSMAQALGATTDAMKTKAERLAPQMLERGISGSRQQMLEQAQAAVKQIGPQIGNAYKAAAETGSTVSRDVVQGTMEFALDAFTTKSATGGRIPIPGAEQMVKRVQFLADRVGHLPADIPVDEAARITTAWQHLVDKGGFYGQKIGATPSDNAAAWALKKGSEEMRTLLEEAVPNVEKLNESYSFWKPLSDVLRKTTRRTQSQTGGLYATIGGAAGAGVGAMAGGPMGSIGGMFAGRKLVQLAQSPAFRTQVSAPMKKAVSDAIMAGDPDGLARATARIAQAMGVAFNDGATAQ